VDLYGDWRVCGYSRVGACQRVITMSYGGVSPGCGDGLVSYSIIASLWCILHNDVFHVVSVVYTFYNCIRFCCYQCLVNKAVYCTTAQNRWLFAISVMSAVGYFYSSRVTFLWRSEEEYMTSMNILRTCDRPTNDWLIDRPRILENFERPYLGNGSSDPLHVWF